MPPTTTMPPSPARRNHTSALRIVSVSGRATTTDVGETLVTLIV